MGVFGDGVGPEGDNFNRSDVCGVDIGKTAPFLATTAGIHSRDSSLTPSGFVPKNWAQFFSGL